jgi:Dolichyl-phosphate-mannose-protein mannosyltransferase
LIDSGTSISRFFPSGSTGLQEEYRKEKDAERNRRERFPDRFPGIASLPVINRAFSVVYCHGFPYVLLLLLSIVVFTVIKAPYFATPFTGEHSMKYNTYVEPALHMTEKGSMLWYQKRYIADPVHNPEGIQKRFDHLPLMEWGLYATYKLFPDSGIEIKTRLFNHIIGILILLAAYRFFIGYFPKSFSVAFIGLLSLHPVVSFASYVTVLDSIAILFMFLSLTEVSGYFRQRKISGLVRAGIWFGLGNAVKYPLFLWLAPISFLFIYFESRNAVSFMKNYVVYIGISLLVTFGAMAVVKSLIPLPAFALLLTLILVAFLFLAWYCIDRYENAVDRFMEYLWARKAILVMAAAVLIISGIVLLRFMGMNDFAEEFLTESGLVANYRLYKYMLFHQFKGYMTRNLFWFGFAGALLALVTREKAMGRIWFPFLFGSVVYWIVASKSIFFHIYYSMIIVITLTLAAAYFMYFVAVHFRPWMHRAVISLCFVLLTIPPILDATEGRMKNYVNVEKVVEFINANTRPDELILFEGYLTPLSIYTGRGFVMPAVLINDTIRDDIREIGFAGTMKKYKVKYLFTPREQPYYLDYAPIFERTNIREPSGTNFNRIITVFKTIGVQNAGISSDLEKVKEIGEKYHIEEKFVLVAKIDRFRFYSFRN